MAAIGVGGVILAQQDKTIITPPDESSETAHIWVDTDGGTCTRSSSPAEYSSAAACSTFAAATSAATTGDTIRVKSGAYGLQGSIGHASKVTTFIGEDTVTVDCGSQSPQYNCFNLSGNVTADNIDIVGDYPIVQIAGTNSTWQNSTYHTAREILRCDSDEPLLIQSDGDTITNASVVNVVLEQQKGSVLGEGGCTTDNKHLELVRIGQNVNGVLFDRVTFGTCPDGDGFVGCGSGQVFITTPTGGTTDPSNIVFRNSIFHSAVNQHIQTHSNVQCSGFVLAYNTFSSDPWDFCDNQNTGTVVVGNVGARPQTCWSGVTFTKNVWQHAVGSPCGTDTFVTGSSFSIDQLGIDSAMHLEAGSVAIDAGETPGASDYCTGALGSQDFDGDTRPVGLICDAGADER